MPVLIIIGVILLVLVIANVRIVPQATEYVIEFLGKYKTTWSAGLHVKIPFLEAIAKKITIKEQGHGLTASTGYHKRQCYYAD